MGFTLLGICDYRDQFQESLGGGFLILHTLAVKGSMTDMHTSLRHIQVNPAPPHMACSSQVSCWSMGKVSATASEDCCTGLGEITYAYW